MSRQIEDIKAETNIQVIKRSIHSTSDELNLDYVSSFKSDNNKSNNISSNNISNNSMLTINNEYIHYQIYKYDNNFDNYLDSELENSLLKNSSCDMNSKQNTHRFLDLEICSNFSSTNIVTPKGQCNNISDDKNLIIITYLFEELSDKFKTNIDNYVNENDIEELLNDPTNKWRKKLKKVINERMEEIEINSIKLNSKNF